MVFFPSARKALIGVAAVLALVTTSSAFADVVSPTPLTPKVQRSTTWGAVRASATIQGVKYTYRTSGGSSANYRSQATFWLRQSGSNGSVRGAYGWLTAHTQRLWHLQVPGGSVPKVSPVSGEAQTTRTTGSAMRVATVNMPLGTSQRGGWTKKASVCIDVRLMPDSCSASFNW